MTNEEKRAANEQKVAGALLNTAIDRLGELSAPYVLLIGGRVLTNCSGQLCRVIVCDAAALLQAVHEKRIDAEADREVFGITGGGDDESKTTA